MMQPQVEAKLQSAIEPANAKDIDAEPQTPIGALTSYEQEDVELPDIPIDSDYSDADSSYGESIESESCSIGSSITRYRFENGRRYHAYRDGAYWAPNDEIQNDQQDLAHHLWLLTLDGQLHLAPIQNPQQILDIGTGTGIWALDIADKYPAAIVRGIDLSPTQPIFVTPNCHFEIDDVTLPWTFPHSSYDYIHVREMFGSIPDWPYLFSQCFSTLKPGGWVESVEHSVWPVSDDATIGPDHIFSQYGRIMTELADLNGKEFDCYKKNRQRMVDAGFVDVVEVRTKWPMRGWSSNPKMRELGRWNQARIERGIEGFAMRMLTNVGGWMPEEVRVFTDQISLALRDRSVHGYLEVSIVYGRKPLQGETNGRMQS